MLETSRLCTFRPRLHGPDPQGHDIKLTTFETRVAFKFIIILQNLTTPNQRKSGKSKYDVSSANTYIVTENF